MLVIRQHQIATFEQEAEADFVGRISSRLLSCGASEDAKSVELFVRTGVATARKFFLTREADVVEFLEIVWEGFGAMPAFPRSALAILSAHTTDTIAKLARFEAWVEEMRSAEEFEESDDDV